MPAVTIRKEYVSILKPSGRVETIVDEALKKYLIDTSTSRVEKAKCKLREFEKKYGTDFKTFERRIAEEKFAKSIETKNPAWEADFHEREYWFKELDEWMERLKNVLTKS